MIIVTGATGQLGRQIVEHLLERVPAEHVGVSVRDPARAHDLEARGVRVRAGDFEDASSLEHAFEGASRVLVVSANALGEPAIRMNRTAIDAAAASGAERILYTSHVGVAAESPFPPMPTHFASEAALRESGVPFTALRNGLYAAFAVTLLGDAAETGELRAPADGPVSFTAHPDLAEAAAIALADDGLDAEVIPLTASSAVDLTDVAAIASEHFGSPIERVVVDDDEYRAGMLAAGVPELRVAISMGYFEAARQGGFAHVDPALAELIGRAPMTIGDALAD